MNLLELLMNLDETNEENLIMAQKVNGRFTAESEAATCRVNEIVIGMDFFETTEWTYEYLCNCVDDPHNQAGVRAGAIKLIEEINNGDGSSYI